MVKPILIEKGKLIERLTKNGELYGGGYHCRDKSHWTNLLMDGVCESCAFSSFYDDCYELN